MTEAEVLLKLRSTAETGGFQKVTAAATALMEKFASATKEILKFSGAAKLAAAAVVLLGQGGFQQVLAGATAFTDKLTLVVREIQRFRAELRQTWAGMIQLGQSGFQEIIAAAASFTGKISLVVKEIQKFRVGVRQVAASMIQLGQDGFQEVNGAITSFTGKLASVGQEIRKFGEGIKQAATGMLKLAQGGFQQVIAATTSLVGEITGIAKEIMAFIERIKQAATSLVELGQKILSVAETALKLADRFGLTGIIAKTLVKQLVPVGLEMVGMDKSANKAATAIGFVAGKMKGTSLASTELGGRLQQVSGGLQSLGLGAQGFAGKLQLLSMAAGLVLLPLTILGGVAGIATKVVTGLAMGVVHLGAGFLKATSGAVGFVSRVVMLANSLISFSAAIKAAGGAGPLIADVGKQFATFGPVITSLGASLQGVFGEKMRGLFASLAISIQGAGTALKSMLGLGKAAQGIAMGFNGAASSAAGLRDRIAGVSQALKATKGEVGVEKIADAFDKAVAAGGKLKDQVVSLSSGLGGLKSGFTGAAASALGLGKGIDGTKASITPLKGEIKQVNTDITTMSITIKSMKKALASDEGSVGIERISDAFDKVSAKVKGFVATLKTMASANLAKFSTPLVAGLRSISDHSINAMMAMYKAGNGAQDTAKKFGEVSVRVGGLGTIFSTLSKALEHLGSQATIFGGVWSVATQKAGVFRGALTSLAGMVGGVSKAFQGVSANAGAVGTVFKTLGIENAAKKFGEFAVKVGGVGGGLSGLGKALGHLSSQASVFGSVWSGATAKAGFFRGVVLGLAGAAGTAGKALQGLSANAGAVGTALRSSSELAGKTAVGFGQLANQFYKLEKKLPQTSNAARATGIALGAMGDAAKMAGTQLGNLSEGTGAVTTGLWLAKGAGGGFLSMLIKFVGGLSATTVGVGLFVIALAAVSVALIKVGQQFEKQFRIIAQKTGEVGPKLEELKADFLAVGAEATVPLGRVAEAVSALHQRLDITGEPLRALTTQLMQLEQMGVTVSVASLTRAFGDWSIATEAQSGALDRFFAIQQQSGIEMERMTQLVTQYGGPMRQLGFSFETATALLARFENEGVNTELVMGSLRISLTAYAKAGLPAEEAMATVIAKIKEMGFSYEATTLAGKVFGAQAGPDMAAAIIEGRFEIDDYTAALKNADGQIAKTAESTLTFGQRVQEAKNKIAVSLQPVGSLFQKVWSDSKKYLLDGVVAILLKFCNWFTFVVLWLDAKTRNMRLIIGAWVTLFMIPVKIIWKILKNFAYIVWNIIKWMLRTVFGTMESGTSSWVDAMMRGTVAILRGWAIGMRKLIELTRRAVHAILVLLNGFFQALPEKMRAYIGVGVQNIGNAIIGGLDDIAAGLDEAAAGLEAAFNKAKGAMDELESTGEIELPEIDISGLTDGAEKAEKVAKDKGEKIGDALGEGMVQNFDAALKRLELELLKAEFLPTGDLPADMVQAIQRTAEMIGAKLQSEWDLIDANLTVPQLDFGDARGVEEKMAVYQEWVEEQKIAEEDRFRRRMANMAIEANELKSDEAKAKVVEQMDAEQQRHDLMMGYFDDEGKALMAMYAVWQAAMAEQKANIAARQKEAERWETDVANKAKEGIDSLAKAEEARHKKVVEYTTFLTTREKIRHDAAMKAITDEGDAIKGYLDDWKERIDDLKLGLDTLTIDLDIPRETALLDGLKAQLDAIKAVTDTLVVFGGEDRQKAMEKEKERIALTTEGQKQMLEAGKDLLTGDLARAAELLLAGYSQKADVVREIFAKLSKDMENQVNAQQAIIDGKNAEILVVQQRINQEEYLLKLATDQSEDLLKAIEDRNVAETARYDAETTRIASLVAAEEEKFNKTKESIATLREIEDGRHTARMVAITEEYALELARLDHTQAEIDQMMADAIQRSIDVGKAAGQVIEEAQRQAAAVATTGAFEVGDAWATSATMASQAWVSGMAVMGAAVQRFAHVVAIAMKPVWAAITGTPPGDEGGEDSSDAQRKWKRSKGFAGKYGFLAGTGTFDKWYEKWYGKKGPKGDTASGRGAAGMKGPFDKVADDALDAAGKIQLGFFVPMENGFHKLIALVTDLGEQLIDLVKQSRLLPGLLPPPPGAGPNEMGKGGSRPVDPTEMGKGGSRPVDPTEMGFEYYFAALKSWNKQAMTVIASAAGLVATEVASNRKGICKLLADDEPNDLGFEYYFAALGKWSAQAMTVIASAAGLVATEVAGRRKNISDLLGEWGPNDLGFEHYFAALKSWSAQAETVLASAAGLDFSHIEDVRKRLTDLLLSSGGAFLGSTGEGGGGPTLTVYASTANVAEINFGGLYFDTTVVTEMDGQEIATKVVKVLVNDTRLLDDLGKSLATRGAQTGTYGP